MDKLLNGEYRILSFDPGSYSLGMAVCRLNIPEMTITVLHAETLKIDRRLDTTSFNYLIHGERNERLSVITDYVVQCCKTWGPNACVIELPYLGRIASAFGSLKEVVLTLRKAFMLWCPSRSPFFYEPSVVKKAAGVDGRSGDKTLMTKALLSTLEIDKQFIDVSLLDEHSIDAIMIAHAHLKLGILKKEIPNGKRERKPKRL